VNWHKGGKKKKVDELNQKEFKHPQPPPNDKGPKEWRKGDKGKNHRKLLGEKNKRGGEW